MIHKYPFINLVNHENEDRLPDDFIQKWCVPFYMQINSLYEVQNYPGLIELKSEMSKEVMLKLLGDRNWRTRSTGAFFAAIKGYSELIHIIGSQLLKSELVYAGQVYSQVLAYFNTNDCVGYLDKYLSYYLTEKDLWYDQKSVMQALAYLDRINGTHNLEKYYPQYLEFIENKPNWGNEISTTKLEERIALIKDLAD